jgi:hypothetical protein
MPKVVSKHVHNTHIYNIQYVCTYICLRWGVVSCEILSIVKYCLMDCSSVYIANL